MGLIHNLNIPLVSGCFFFPPFLTSEIKGSSRSYIFSLLSLVVSVLCTGQAGNEKPSSVTIDATPRAQWWIFRRCLSIGGCFSPRNVYWGREMFQRRQDLGSSLAFEVTLTQCLWVKCFANHMQTTVQCYMLSKHLIFLVAKVIDMSVVSRCWNEASLFKYEGKRWLLL